VAALLEASAVRGAWICWPLRWLVSLPRSAAPAGSRLALLKAALAQRGGVSQLLGISCAAEALPAVLRVLRTQLGVLPPDPFQPKTCHGHVRPPPGGGAFTRDQFTKNLKWLNWKFFGFT